MHLTLAITSLAPLVSSLRMNPSAASADQDPRRQTQEYMDARNWLDRRYLYEVEGDTPFAFTDPTTPQGLALEDVGAMKDAVNAFMVSDKTGALPEGVGINGRGEFYPTTPFAFNAWPVFGKTSREKSAQRQALVQKFRDRKQTGWLQRQPDMEDIITFKVHLHGYPDVKITTNPLRTVEEIKEMHVKVVGIPVDQQVYYYRDIDLENDRTLESYGIGEGATIRLEVFVLGK